MPVAAQSLHPLPHQKWFMAQVIQQQATQILALGSPDRPLLRFRPLPLSQDFGHLYGYISSLGSFGLIY